MNPKRINQSSGDITADRRADYARQYAKAGEFAAAADLVAQALELVPRHLPFMVMQASFLEKADCADSAADIWRSILAADPADPHGAELKLAKLGRAMMPDRSPAAYVQALFDDFAPRFDKTLVEKLAYCAPDLLAAALADHGPHAHVIDLGCGTGLMGERLRMQASFMEGLDLSPGMLKLAKDKGVYDHLAEADLATDFRTRCNRGDVQADLAVAADVLIYVGDLDAVFTNVARTLEYGGLFAFTVETHDGLADFELRQSLRFAHRPAYVTSALGKAGFDVHSLENAILREDAGAPITGLVVVARKRPAAVTADGEIMHSPDGDVELPSLH